MEGTETGSALGQEEDEVGQAAGEGQGDDDKGSFDGDFAAVAAAVNGAAAVGAEQRRASGEVLVDGFKTMARRIRWGALVS